MHSLTGSSGDLLADRRYAYAEDLMAEGEAAAAADLLRQTLERVPGWAPAWLALALAEEKRGDVPAATAALERARGCDPTGRLGADLHLARLRGTAIAAMPDAYVAALFDGYAPRFERHLVDGLGYRGPAAIMAALEAAGVAGPARHALDLGCGTGLMGAAIRDAAERLDGLDLSPAMVEQARRLGLYDRLDVATIADGLAGRPAAHHDLILAADVLVYVGDLLPVVAEGARVLTPGGLLAVTMQRGGPAPMRLGDDLRFAHSPAYVRDVLGKAGLALLHLGEVSTRRDAGRDVPGLVVVARQA